MTSLWIRGRDGEHPWPIAQAASESSSSLTDVEGRQAFCFLSVAVGCCLQCFVQGHQLVP